MSQTEVQLIKDAVIVNADVSNSAAIAVSKLSGVMPSAGGTFSGDVSFGDNNITNVGIIALDTIKGDGDDNTNITFATNDVITFKCGSTSPALTVNTTQVKIEDGQQFVAGTGNDLQILHSGGVNQILSGGANLKIGTSGETFALFKNNNAVELYYDNSKKFETTANGIELPNNSSLFLGGKIDMTDSASTSTGRILLGTGDDLQIYHTGTDSVIDNTTGELQLASDAVMRFQATEYKFNNAANTEKVANFFQDGACELYFNHSKKFETLTDGVNITGTLKVNGSAFSGGIASLVEDTSPQLGGNLDTNSFEISLDDSHAITFGDSNDLSIQHIGGNYSHISDSSSLRISSAEIRFRDANNQHTTLFVDADGATQLYHNTTARFVTSSAGVGMVQSGDKFTWPASSGAGPEIYNGGSSIRDLKINIDNDHKYTLHQNGILYQEGANSSNGGAYTSPHASYPVRVWLSFNDEDNITNGVGGVSSVSDTGTGTFTINFGTSFPDDNYAMTATSGGQSGTRGDDTCITHGATNPGTGSIGIRTRKFTDNNFTNSESAMFIFVR